jgi:hypothetical protein
LHFFQNSFVFKDLQECENARVPRQIFDIQNAKSFKNRPKMTICQLTAFEIAEKSAKVEGTFWDIWDIGTCGILLDGRARGCFMKHRARQMFHFGFHGGERTVGKSKKWCAMGRGRQCSAPRRAA